MKKLVLVSGGLDSATLLAHVADNDTIALFFNYNQKALDSELCAVKKLVQFYKIPVIYKNITGIFDASECALLSTSSKDPANGNTELEFRNGVLLSCAISLAMQLFPGEVISILIGLIKIRLPYADCSADFISLYNSIARLSSNNLISVSAPFLNKGKDEVLAIARDLNLDIQSTWSCYNSGGSPCGVCDACIDRKILGVL